MGDRSVRPAEPADVEAIQSIARQSWHAAYDDILGTEAVDDVVDEWYKRSKLETAIRDEAVFVAESSSIDGFAHVGPGDGSDTMELRRIYVHPERWGEGFGSQLLERVEKWCLSADRTRLRLAVLADNEVGIEFYERNGFTAQEHWEGEIANVPVEDIVYEKELE